MSAPRAHARSRILTLGILLFAGAHALAAQVRPASPGPSVVDLGPAAAGSLRTAPRKLRLERLPLAGADRTLSLERFEVFAPGAQVVVARPGGWQVIPTPRIAFWRGEVEGLPDSSVVLAVADTITLGSIDLGAGAGRYRVTSFFDKANHLPDGQLALTKEGDARRGVLGPVGPAGPGRLCAVTPPVAPLITEASPEPLEPQGDPADGGTAVPRRLRVQLAVDTDHEFYTLFGDANAAATYVAMLYGQVSAVYQREIKVAVELSFVRIWDTPTDPYDVPTDELLGFFRNHWQTTMQGVTRDLAQLASGRRDLAYGGIAYVNGVCNSVAYSVVGYLLGYYPDPGVPSAEGYDIMVTAHEIGHNFGTLHTHDYNIDTCDEIETPARRGSIMSYCSQTVSGGNSVMDLRFETGIRSIMRNYLRQRPCVDRDCNANSVPDSQDIASGASLDANANGVPDECEDCNTNGVFDSLDIATGHSLDRNANGIPDECEPDCNLNGRPDDLDITLGASQDVYADGVPDECQADCDANGVADYNQIQADMTLDIDRNRVLDACQDCDADGTNDILALNGSLNLWIATAQAPEVIEFYHPKGVRMRTGTSPGLDGVDVVITPDRRIFVASGNDDRVAEFDRTGAFVGNFAQGGPLDNPGGMALTPRNTLLVVSRATASVLEYDLATGALVGTLVAPGSGGLADPFAIVLNGNELLVSADNASVRRYDATTGAYLGLLVAPGAGGLVSPRGLLVKPDGNLLVTSFGTNQVLEYDAVTGAPLGQWNHNGTNSVLRLLSPWCIRYGPDGNVYVSVSALLDPGHFEPPPFLQDPQLHVTNTKVFRFDVESGNFLTSYVIGEDTEMHGPTGMAFMPVSETDCNANQFPDACEIAQGLAPDCNANGVPDSCDIASGLETDFNRNAVPDSCECLADWNDDGTVNSTDVSDFINDWFTDQAKGSTVTDFNHDGVSNSTDVSDFINAYFGGEGTCI